MTGLSIDQLINMERVQQILEANYRITGASTAILDTNENVLATTAWQEICARFHRVHPEACERCRESDATIKGYVSGNGKGYLDYLCKNGMRDVAMPITIGNEHIATFFMGQFFYDDDRRDREHFRAQAREFGFDETDYLEALGRVPVFTREQVRNFIEYYGNLVQILTETGMKKLELLHEIWKRENAELAQERINRALKTLSSFNQVLVQVKSEAQLMARTCRVILEVGKYAFAWVGFADNNAEKTVRPVAQCGFEEGVLDCQRLTWADNERGRGPTGTAIRTGDVSLVQHIASSPDYRPWRDDVLRRGYASCISLPLDDEERTFGAITIYAEEPDAFDAEEIALLKELADDLAYGIVSIRRQAENKKLERLLRQAQKMETIGTLARGIAHDFNNILGAIINNVEMALEDAHHGCDLRELLEDVQKAGYRGRDLVRRISTFSRHTEMERQPVSLEVILKECLKLLRPGIPPNVLVLQHIPSHVSMISADPTQIHQVIVNLCTNAVQAMRGKGGVLELRIEEREMDGNVALLHPDLQQGTYLVLSVKDTGHGMDSEIMERIFDPFFTTKEHDEGSGLGLSVAYGILKSHGGAILVDSTPGEGATFQVFFPRNENLAESGERDKPEGIPRGNERILLIDDDEDLVTVQRKMLRRLGYLVVAETSPFEALKLFNRDPARFDLIITDLAMPGMSGYELADTILRVRPDISVILATAHLTSTDGGVTSEEAKAAGIREILKKPTSRLDMARAIRRVLDEQR